MSAHRVLICDDHWIVRRAIRETIDGLPEFEAVAEAGDGAEVMAMVREHRPDLVIIDIEMSEVNGIEAMGHVFSRWPETRVLVFSAHEDEDLVRLAAREGAAGFLVKSADAEQIEAACKSVVAGNRWFPGYAGRLDKEDDLQRLRSLSEREYEILSLLAGGMKTQQVAAEVGLRPATVYTHVRNVIAKLGVDTRTQAVAIATRYSFLEATSQRTPGHTH
jgi:DNA-binding NarL/FixJ family response regulator